MERKHSDFDVENIQYINGETAIKPYWYFRNGLLHCRFNVDRCVELTKDECFRLKAELTEKPCDKQNVLRANWNFFTEMLGKSVIQDGIKAGEDKMKELAEIYDKRARENVQYDNEHRY